ncbi:hypothetical protein AAW30_01490 [Arcobacter porcinus]|uniref:DUF4917 family protein n=1 Tax=Arcobacter porcinus TaxID=1935204 RepID=UPI00082450DC|nr:DUF4917 family protein [Arcobacter porcinus]OCL82666.1 hypothetical protein AAW30_01490 [Arcobacter porcinus]
MQEELLSFDEVLENTKDFTRNLLLGNGFSMAFDHKRFSFTNLLQSAVDNKIIIKDSEMHNIFKSLGTSDFENVIKLLESSSNVLSIYDSNSSEIIEKLNLDSKALKNHLVDVVTNNHPEKATKIDEDEYLNCMDFLKVFDRIFTLNYDLLLFWSLMKFNELKGNGTFNKDKDCRLVVSDGFGNSEEGNDTNYVIFKNNDSVFYQTIHYLHGALHIFDNKSEIIKNTYSRTDKTLKQQTLENLDKYIYPIFISEGTANQKKAKIIHNAYLNNSLKTLRTLSATDKKFKKENCLIIFGSMLKSNDEHIIEAIVESKIRNIFVGIGSLSKKSELSFFEEKLSEKRITLQYYDYKTVKVWR